MKKEQLNSQWNKNTTVICDGKPICLVNSIKEKLYIDIWLLTHPFYSDSQVLIDSEGRVERFMKKYNLSETGF